jgi:eukaryotic-like serine/threonine-protein kinase
MPTAFERLSVALADRYVLQREIGSGGMATVYLAKDVRHQRRVAIKVLKPELAAVLGSERFLAEIRTTANLQHPHILPLFDSGAADGFVFYVMPFVSGESLRERLDRERQLPIEDALAITRAVARALDHAHRHGVVHRDIKPENILLHEGNALVADFGIALAVSAAGGGRLTETGFTVGTPRYMSPEQVSAEKEIRGPSDIYSLGVVLYEMLAGDAPHSGPNAHAVLTRILVEKPPRLREVRRSVPPNVEAVAARALEKYPADRFESGERMAQALDDPAFRWPPVAASAESAVRVWKSAFAAAVAVVLALSALLAWRSGRPAIVPTADAAIRLSFTLPRDELIELFDRSPLAISDDGSRIVYLARAGGERRMNLRALSDFGAHILPGTAGASQPFFSPDGEWIGFFADGMLKKVHHAGGTPVDIAVVTMPRGGSWGEDDTILFSHGGTSLWRVPAAGGTPVELPVVLEGVAEDEAELVDGAPAGMSVFEPRFLPGGKDALAVVMWPHDGREPTRVITVDLSTGRARLLRGIPFGLGLNLRPTYMRSGHIAFYAGRETVSVVPFSLSRGEATGPPVSVVGDAVRPAGSSAVFAVAGSGAIAYVVGGFDRTLVLVDRAGRETPIPVGTRGYRFPRVSPDGRWVAVTVDPQPPQIWVVDLLRETEQPLTQLGYNLGGAWSVDGSRFAFHRINVDSPGIHVARWPAGGALDFVGEYGGSLEWTHDDRLIAAPGRVTASSGDLYIIDTATRTATELVATAARERQPAVSRDGRWVAYTSDVSGFDEVYVLPYVGVSAPVRVSRRGGSEPVWSRDGGELYYRSEGTIWAASVQTAPTFELLSAPQPLFSGPFDFSNDRNWDVLPDGRFVMVRSDPNVGREVRVVLSWSAATPDTPRP